MKKYINLIDIFAQNSPDENYIGQKEGSTNYHEIQFEKEKTSFEIKIDQNTVAKGLISE